MSQSRTIKDSMALIDQFLSPVRAQAQKEASMRQKKAADDSTSFKDTSEATPQNQATPKPGSTSQESLGKEQQTAAEDSGSTATTESENSEADAKQFADTQGTQTLSTDDKVREKGNIGPIVETLITQEQKMARAENLGNAILNIIAGELEKNAAKKPAAAPKAAPKPVKTPPGQVPNTGMPGKELPSPKQAAGEVHPVLQKMASVAALAAQEYYEGYLAGMIKRAQDEAEVAASGIAPQVLEKVGGVSGLLDKVAEDFPAAVLPEGIGEAMPPEAAPAEEAPAPAEGGTEGGDVEAVAAALDEAGVTPEELQQAIEDVAALQEAGVTPDQLAGALSGGELAGGEGGEAAPAEEPPAEAPAEEPPKEEESKEASAAAAAKIRAILNRPRR